MKEGQAWDGVEVLTIDSGRETVSLNVVGKARSLALEEPDGTRATNKLASSPFIHLVSVDLQCAISLYADFKNRTVLQHPQLGDPTFSVRSNPQSNAEAAAIFEKMFHERNIATIPDGDEFMMVIPFAFTNTVKPHANAVGSTNVMLPRLSVNFRQAPVPLILQAYADYVGEKIVNRHDMPWNPTVTFVQTTPLSKDQVCYAFETLMTWCNIRLVPDGSDLKWERIHEPN